MALSDEAKKQARRAQRLVKAAVTSGDLIRPPLCELCGSEGDRALDGHHWNGYDEAHVLDVQWLCRTCHGRVHAGPQSWESLTPAQRSERSRQISLAITAEERSERSRRAGKAAMSKLSPEERSAFASLGGQTNARRQTADQRSDRARNARRHLSADRLSEIGRLGAAAQAAKLSPERRREIALNASKAATEARRRRQEM